jgi:hypothetical protein
MPNQDVSRLIKTIYASSEEALNNAALFEPHTDNQVEFAINHVAACFDVPNFVCVSVEGEVYQRADKHHFIEDMRVKFADNPNYVIDGMFEYKLEQALPVITFAVPEKYKGRTFAEVFDSL